LRELVERRLEGRTSSSSQSASDHPVDDDDDDLPVRGRLELVHSELTKISAENEALKSQQQTTHSLLDAARQKNTRFRDCSFNQHLSSVVCRPDTLMLALIRL